MLYSLPQRRIQRVSGPLPTLILSAFPAQLIRVWSAYLNRHYVKLFSSIVHSTIWDEEPAISKLWVTMLAISDQHGEVAVPIPGLARLARISVETCESGLAKFQQPDKYSWTKDNEGRRIEEIDGGWRLLNYAKYRQMISESDKKEKAAVRQQRFRERHKTDAKSNAFSNASNTPITPSDGASRQVEVEVEVIKQNQNIGIDEATSKAFLELGLGGTENRMLCQDVIRAYVNFYKCSFAEAADGLILRWNQYSASTIAFKKGIKKFLSEGIWKSPEACTPKPTGKTKPKTAREEAREEAEERERQRNDRHQQSGSKSNDAAHGTAAGRA